MNTGIAMNCHYRDGIMNLWRWIIGGIFLYAGALKAWDPAQFLLDIQGYRLLPHWPAVAVALCLPWLEIVSGLALMCRKWHQGALVILTVLMAVFTLAILSAWLRGLDISCGCFSSHGGTANYPWLVIRDLAILALLICLLLRDMRTTAFRSS